MKHLTNLFKIMELTRSMPQYGYVPAGLPQDELSNLAEHHYLVTFIAWQLARQVKNKGAKINTTKVVEFALVHDLGELFGGDISMPYAKINPKARKYAKMFEEENQKFLAKFFDDDEEYFKKLGKEILNATSDESLIAKFADYVEHAHFKQFAKISAIKINMSLAVPKIKAIISKIKDPIAKRELNKFVKFWVKDLNQRSILDILFGMKDQ